MDKRWCEEFIANRHKFLIVHQDLREWLQNNPNFDGRIKGLWVYEGEHGKIYRDERTDCEWAIGALRKIYYTMAKSKGEEVTWYNESTTECTYPCARQISLDEGKAKNGSRITIALLDYEYAKSHRHDEELRELKDKCYRHNDCITRAEAVKKGIVLLQLGSKFYGDAGVTINSLL